MPSFVFAVLIVPYYVNTSEIPGEVSRENMTSSQVKRSPLLWLHNNSRTLQQKKLFKREIVWNFIGVYIVNRTLHGRLEIRNFSSGVFSSISLISCFEQLFFCFTQFGGVPNAWTLIRVVTQLLYSHYAALTLSVFPYQELQNIIDVTSENQP